jgi:hypothetical protein
MKKNEMLIKIKDQEKKIMVLEELLKESKLKMEEEIILKVELETNKIEERKNDMMRILKREIKEKYEECELIKENMEKLKEENEKNIKLNNKKIDELETKIITIEEINKEYLLKIVEQEKRNNEMNEENIKINKEYLLKIVEQEKRNNEMSEEIEENKKIINELKDVYEKIEKYKNYNDRIIELNKEITETEKKKNEIFEILENNKEVIVNIVEVKEEIVIVEKVKEIKKVNKKNSIETKGDMDNDLSIYIYKNNMLNYIDEDVIKYGCCKNYITGETGKKKHNNFYIEEINDIFIMSMEGVLMNKTTKDRSLIIRRVLNYIFKDEIIYISRYLTTAIIKNEILINKIKEIEETFKNVELINKILEEKNINKINKVELKGKKCDKKYMKKMKLNEIKTFIKEIGHGQGRLYYYRYIEYGYYDENMWSIEIGNKNDSEPSTAYTGLSYYTEDIEKGQDGTVYFKAKYDTGREETINKTVLCIIVILNIMNCEILYKKGNRFINVICKEELKRIEEDITKLKIKNIHLLENKTKMVEILREYYSNLKEEDKIIFEEIVKLIK